MAALASVDTDVLIYVDVISNKQSICFFPVRSAHRHSH